MKKMLAISMSLIMAASLAGCSSGGGAGKSTQPQTAQENAGDKAPVSQRPERRERSSLAILIRPRMWIPIIHWQ